MNTAPHDTVIFDVDGTLVDSTYLHAIAWMRAFRSVEIDVPTWQVHRVIGMGSDLLVAEVAGEDAEREHGDQLRKAHEKEYSALSSEVLPLPGARELIEKLAKDFTIAVGSSGSKDDVRESLRTVGVSADLISGLATSDDAENSKPEPDILQAAIAAAGGTSAIVVGDAPYDVLAAKKLGFPCVAVRTGGFGPEELTAAGAVMVVDHLNDLLDADWEKLARTNV